MPSQTDDTTSGRPDRDSPAGAGAPPAAGEQPEDILSTSVAGRAAVRGGTLRVLGYIVAAPLSLLSAHLLFPHLKPGLTGQYAFALSLVAIVAAFSDLGLTAVGVREMSGRPPAERWPLARDLLGLRITLTAIGTVIVTAIAAAAYSPSLAAGVALACTGLLLQVTQDNLSLPLLLGLRLGWLSALDFARQVLSTLCTIALVLLGATLVPFLAVSVPVGVVILVATWLLVRGVRRLLPTFSLRRWRSFASAVLPYTFAVAASALYLQIAVLLVSALSNKYQAGYFGASFRLIQSLTAIPALVVGSAFPIFARAAHTDHERLGYALGRVFEVAVIVGAWVSVSIAVGSPLAIEIINKAEFGPATVVLAIEGVTLGVTFVSLVWGNGLLSLGLFRVILVINIAALALMALLVGILVPLDGAAGAAIGTAVAEITAAIVQAAAVVHGRPQLRPSLRVLPFVALAAAAGLAPLVLTGLPVIVRLVISTILYGGVVLVTRTFPAELMDLLPRRLHGAFAARRNRG